MGHLKSSRQHNCSPSYFPLRLFATQSTHIHTRRTSTSRLSVSTLTPHTQHAGHSAVHILLSCSLCVLYELLQSELDYRSRIEQLESGVTICSRQTTTSAMIIETIVGWRANYEPCCDALFSVTLSASPPCTRTHATASALSTSAPPHSRSPRRPPLDYECDSAHHIRRLLLQHYRQRIALTVDQCCAVIYSRQLHTPPARLHRSCTPRKQSRRALNRRYCEYLNVLASADCCCRRPHSSLLRPVIRYTAASRLQSTERTAQASCLLSCRPHTHHSQLNALVRVQLPWRDTDNSLPWPQCT